MKVLLIKRGAIGDLLMATPLIRQLKQKQNVTLDLFVGSNAAIACQDNPYIDNFHILPDQDFSIKGIAKLSYRLLKVFKCYDYVFILDKHWYFSSLSRLSGAKIIGYYRKPWEKFLLTHGVLYDDVTRYHCCYYLDLLKISGLATPDYNDLQIDLAIRESDKNKVNGILQQYQLDNFVVVVNSGGNNAYEKTGFRMLPQSLILELLAKLIARGDKVVLLGGHVDYDNYTDYLTRVARPDFLVNFAGIFSLAQSAYLIAKARRFYTTDCGAMHLGVAMGLNDRMTAIFGPTNPAHILPASYLDKSAIWLDESIYDSQYQLQGKLRKSEPAYFMQVDVDECCKKL